MIAISGPVFAARDLGTCMHGPDQCWGALAGLCARRAQECTHRAVEAGRWAGRGPRRRVRLYIQNLARRRCSRRSSPGVIVV